MKEKNDVSKELQNATCVALQFDLWMTKKTEEIFSLNANVGHKNIHLGMPYSNGCADGEALSLAVKSCLEDFAISKKVVSFTQDGGSNLLTCKCALEDSVDFYRSNQYLSKSAPLTFCRVLVKLQLSMWNQMIS